LQICNNARRTAFFDVYHPTGLCEAQCRFCPHAAEIRSIGCQPRRQTLKKTMTLMQKKAQNAPRAIVRIAPRTLSGTLGQIRLPARKTTMPAATKNNRPRGPMPGLRRRRGAVFAVRAFVSQCPAIGESPRCEWQLRPNPIFPVGSTQADIPVHGGHKLVRGFQGQTVPILAVVINVGQNRNHKSGVRLQLKWLIKRDLLPVKVSTHDQSRVCPKKPRRSQLSPDRRTVR
jgi:hypothetical protein